MLGWDWFIAGFYPSALSGIYLVHAKLKLIHIWADRQPPTPLLLWSWCPHWSDSQFAKRKAERAARLCRFLWTDTGRRGGWRKMRKSLFPPEMIKQTIWLNLRTMDKQEHSSSQALSSPNPFKHYLYLGYRSGHLLCFSPPLRWCEISCYEETQPTSHTKVDCVRSGKHTVWKYKERRLIIFNKKVKADKRDICQALSALQYLSK